MILLLFLFAIILGFVFSKGKNIISECICLFMEFLIAFQTGTADYPQYSVLYTYFGISTKWYSGTDIGYQIIATISNKIGLSYNGFMALWGLIALLLIRKTIMEYSKNPSYVWSLYLIYPFLLNLTQFRNFLAISIMIFALPYLSKKGKRNVIIYTVFILIAATIHRMALFYLIFLLSKIKNKSTMFMICIFSTVIGLVGKNIVYWFASKIVFSERLTFYFNKSISIFAFCAYLLILIVNIALVNIAFKQLKHTHTSNEMLCFSATVLDVNCVMLISMVLVSFTADFLRFQRSLFIVNAIVLVASVKSISKLSDRLMKETAIVIYYIISCIAFILWLSYDTIFIPVISTTLSDLPSLFK